MPRSPAHARKLRVNQAELTAQVNVRLAALRGNSAIALRSAASGVRPLTLELLAGGGLAAGQPLKQRLGDADGLVVAADLGLVVPEHRQAVVTAQAVQAQVPDLAASAARRDQGFPDVAEPAIVLVTGMQGGQVHLGGQRQGGFVRQRPATPRGEPAVGHGGDEGPVQSEGLARPGLQAGPQDPAGTAEDGRGRAWPGRGLGAERVLERAAAWAAGRLDDGEAILIVDETADAKSSADAVGAARQYSGTLGGIALCQVAVTLTYASGRGHALVDRSL